MAPVATVLVLAAIGVVGVLSTFEIKGAVMSAAQDVVDQVTAQVEKSKSEVLAKIAELEAREPSVDFSALKASVQGLDDIVPDAVVEPPVEEPVVVPDVPVEEPTV